MTLKVYFSSEYGILSSSYRGKPRHTIPHDTAPSNICMTIKTNSAAKKLVSIGNRMDVSTIKDILYMGVIFERIFQISRVV